MIAYASFKMYIQTDIQYGARFPTTVPDLITPIPDAPRKQTSRGRTEHTAANCETDTAVASRNSRFEQRAIHQPFQPH